MKTILAGPWVGEFGWELFCWQGYLRNLSQKNKIIVVSRPGHENLYADFCVQYIAFDPFSKEENIYTCKEMEGDFEKILKRCEYDEHLDPRKGIVYFHNFQLNKCTNFFDQKFVQYGEKDKVNGYDVIIHARSTDKCKASFRNWSRKNWNDIVKAIKNKGCTVASIGSEKSAMYVDQTDNLLGLSLKELSDKLANSRVIMGPSSGPMHYASLCGLSQIVWSEHKNLNKYLKYWNPFGTKVTFYSKSSWNPSVKDVMDLFEKHFKK